MAPMGLLPAGCWYARAALQLGKIFGECGDSVDQRPQRSTIPTGCYGIRDVALSTATVRVHSLHLFVSFSLRISGTASRIAALLSLCPVDPRRRWVRPQPGSRSMPPERTCRRGGQILAMVRFKRIGRPEEIAELVV